MSRRISGVTVVLGLGLVGVLAVGAGQPARPRQAPSTLVTPVAWMSESAPSEAPAEPEPSPSPTLSGAAWETESQAPGGQNEPVAQAGASTPSGGGVTAQVAAVAETAVMPGAIGDVADDVAIWRNPEHPEQSLILGDNKADTGGGVAVYRLDGSLVHYETTGKIGNIDLRLAGVGDRAVVLVGANDRSNDTLRFWSLDPAAATLTPLEAGALPTLPGNYGFCLGRDPSATHTYAFVTARDSGLLQQYELWAHDGRIDAVKKREFDVGSISEACAVDDVTGSLYVGEEQAGLWRYDVDPATGDRRAAIDRVGGGHLTADVEGVAVVRGADGRGYLLVSSQGDSTFAIYDADGDHAYRGRFTVTGNDGTGNDGTGNDGTGNGSVDAASVTDGMDAASGDFGPNFPHGLLVVHDQDNQTPDGGAAPASNLKLVRLDAVVPLTGGQG